MAYELTKPAADKKKSPQLASTLAKLLKFEQSPNIAEDLEDEQLETIGQDVEREFKIDKESRVDWEKSAEAAMKVALQVREPKNTPWPDAANIKYPLVTVAALQFGARAYPAIVDGQRIVKAQVVGNDSGVPQKNEAGDVRVDPLSQEPLWEVPPGFKRAKAERVSRHMSYQLLNEMTEWEEDTDVLLHHLPIIGCAFRKVWRSEELGRNKAEMVPALDLVVNQKVRSLEEAPRVTHVVTLYPHEIENKKRAGTFLDIDLPASVNTEGNDGSDDDAPHTFLEQHRYLDLDDDGYREPYIVTVHKDSCKVVRIVANFSMKKIKDDGKRITLIPKEEYFVKYSFIPDPKGGFYDIGFGMLLESVSETINTILNQMIDAGTLQNAGGGLIGSGIRLKKNKITVSPGKYEQVETSGDLRAQVMPFQHQGPSPVLFQLLGTLIEAARDITATKDIMTGDSGGKVQTATTTLALIEQGLKVFTAIYKRIYRAMKHEFKLLFELNAKFIDEKAYFTFNDEQEVVEASDYDIASMDICPLADPSMVTDMQRQARTQVLLQIAENPVLGPRQNPDEVLKRVYDVARIEESEKLIVKQSGPSPIEQLTLAEAQGKVKKLEADAANSAAQAKKTEVETDLLPKNALIEAEEKQAKLALERDRMGHDKEQGHETRNLRREELAFGEKSKEKDRDHATITKDKEHEHASTEKHKDRTAKTAGAAKQPKTAIQFDANKAMAGVGDVLKKSAESNEAAMQKAAEAIANTAKIIGEASKASAAALSEAAAQMAKAASAPRKLEIKKAADGSITGGESKLVDA